ncbi:helix-turn-helix transcriptional regulator [Spiractinospora alimapuensis]|uniref:ArsR/SmtB family transcription factor n=1 Tax=Spiractinospora alimapuensis TaxID=2820884 RepID=UPI001F25CE12|nr:helix-turn-helix domain-containing protein [Spiractinospora alimapuensis]QVQ53282.1 helix-turn-helix transcriptional regulator [Spiractinospora alimapuensis]
MSHDDRPAPGESSLDRRMAALERRVEALEGRASTTAAEHDEPLWVLDGVRARAEAPGAVVLAGAVTVPDGRAAHYQVNGSTSELLGSDFADRVEALSALAHPVRLRILQRLLTDASTVQDLADNGDFGTSGQIYHHLRQLVSAGWLQAQGRGRYEVPVARVVPLLTVFLAVDG